MASNFHIQKPYVLATLPRPLDHSEGLGHYVCGEVFGQQGSKRKRKRSEISVGIDGDAVNIYDVCRFLQSLLLCILLIAASRYRQHGS